MHDKTTNLYLCDHVFTPGNILSAMDLAGGVCNLQAYEVIRSVEILLGKILTQSKKFETILPHKWRICNTCKKLHQYCDLVIPMKHYVTINDKCIEFTDIIDVTKNCVMHLAYQRLQQGEQ